MVDGTVNADHLSGRVVVVSPHLDDAILSVGAALSQAARRGAEVIVVTVLAGDPASAEPAGEWDGRAGFRTAGEAARGRMEEDARACAVVHATPRWLPFSSDEYERGGTDAEVWAALAPELDRADSVLIPGYPLSHPDHDWLARLVLQHSPAAPLALYVEQPYAPLDRKRPTPDEPSPLPVTQAPWQAVAVGARDRIAKIRACRAYASQLPLLGRRLPRLVLHDGPRGVEAIARVDAP